MESPHPSFKVLGTARASGASADPKKQKRLQTWKGESGFAILDYRVDVERGCLQLSPDLHHGSAWQLSSNHKFAELIYIVERALGQLRVDEAACGEFQALFNILERASDAAHNVESIECELNRRRTGNH